MWNRIIQVSRLEGFITARTIERVGDLSALWLA
jgi:hypothetical protein